MKHINCETKGDVHVVTFNESEMGINYDADEMRDELDAIIAGTDHPKLVLNMDGVAYVCSRVIATLLYIHKKIWETGGSVKLSNVSDYVHETLRAAKLHRVMDIYTSEAEALAAMAEGQGAEPRG